MSAQRIRGDDAVSDRPASVDSVRQLSILKYYQVHIVLGHPFQRQLQSSIPAVTDIVGAKMYWLPPPRRTPSTPVNPLPTQPFRPPPPLPAPLTPASTFYDSWSCSAHDGLSFQLPSLLPS